MTISMNLKRLMDKEGINASELGRSIKLAQPVIHRLLTGKNTNPKLATIRPIATFFDVTISQLIGEEILLLDSQVGEGSTWKQVPVLDWSEIENYMQKKTDLQPGQPQLSTDALITDQAYAAIIESTGLEPHFPKGAKIIVEPNRHMFDGDFCVVISSEDGAAHIRQVISDGADTYLRSLNPAISSMTMLRSTEAHALLGVIVQAKLYY